MSKIKENLIATAPMEDVTDTVFRSILLNNTSHRKIDYVFTEFVPTDGLCHVIGKDKVSHRLLISPAERELLDKHDTKIIVQVWGSDPEKFRQSVKLIEDNYDFDGFDINMGCPMKKIMKLNGGSALIDNPNLARDIVLATKDSTNKPISVKTRTGISTHTTESWLRTIIDTKPDMITLHGRTRNMMYRGEADWLEIKKAVDMAKSSNPDIIFLGNGDIRSLEQADKYCNEYNVDGVMIGRAMMGNPFIFSERPLNQQSIQERLELLLHHCQLFTEYWGDEKVFSILKKFFKAYISGFQNAAEMRATLMRAKSNEHLQEIVNELLSNYS